MQHHIGDDVYEKSFNFSLLLRIWKYILPHLRKVILAMIFLAGSNISFLLFPYFLKLAIDRYIIPHKFTGLAILGLVFLGIRLVSWVCSYWHELYMAQIGQLISYQIRLDLFQHLQNLSKKYFDAKKVGWIIARLTSDINAIEEFFGFSVTGIVNTLFILGGTVVLMLSLNIKLSLITFTILPPLLLVSLYLGRKARKAYRRTRITNTDLVINLAENITGIRVTQLFVREKENMEVFEEVNERNYQAHVMAETISAVYMPLVGLIGSAGTVLILWFGGAAVIKEGITIGILVAFTGYINRFFEPIRTLTELYNHMLNAMAAGERLWGVLDTPILIKDIPNAINIDKIHGDIKFKNIWFTYDGSKYVLKDINFDVNYGQTIALVGPTGAGKSSIMSLVARFYDYTKGSITIDGHELKDISIKSLRNNMGIVLQDTFLFAGTIKDNIQYGNLDASMEDIERAARLTGANEFIEEFPNKYLTDVREQGNRLSVGQKQLISFSRALLRDPRILILDEATSSIDAYMEYKIQRALKELLKGRICFVAAHRLSTIKNADLILVVDNGLIAERGNHAELLKAGGIYKKFYESRFQYISSLEKN